MVNGSRFYLYYYEYWTCHWKQLSLFLEISNIGIHVLSRSFFFFFFIPRIATETFHDSITHPPNLYCKSSKPKRKPSTSLPRIPTRASTGTTTKNTRKVQLRRLLPTLRRLRSLPTSPFLHARLGRESREHLLGFRPGVFAEVLMRETLLGGWSGGWVQCEKRGEEV